MQICTDCVLLFNKLTLMFNSWKVDNIVMSQTIPNAHVPVTVIRHALHNSHDFYTTLFVDCRLMNYTYFRRIVENNGVFFSYFFSSSAALKLFNHSHCVPKVFVWIAY